MTTKRWVNTQSGQRFFPLKPDPASIFIGDIAHHLSNLCRYTGATDGFYSVAQHSVIVSELCDPADALWGLLHDAAEAYINDLNRPVKHAPELVGYRKIEAGIMRAVCDRFDLPFEQPASVSAADNYIIAIERDSLFENPNPFWQPMERHERAHITPWLPSVAKRAFLNRYEELCVVLSHS